jgi:hypothetical protein
MTIGLGTAVMSRRSTKFSAHGLAKGVLPAVFWLLAWPIHGQSGPFDYLTGSWSGTGVVKMTEGGSERIKCKALYELPGSSTVRIRLTCASDTYKIELSGSLQERDGAITGSWSEATRKVEGSLSGRVSGNQIVLTTSGIVAGTLTLTTTGNRQTALLQPQGAKVRSVSITMTREGMTVN